MIIFALCYAFVETTAYVTYEYKPFKFLIKHEKRYQILISCRSRTRCCRM